jgi:hypothetical protein
MRQRLSSAIEEAKDEAKSSLRKIFKMLLEGLIYFLCGPKEDHMPPTTPEEERPEDKQEEAQQAVMEEEPGEEEELTKTHKKDNEKLLVVENAYPVRENSSVKRSITDVKDGYYRVNFKAWGTGLVTETAMVRVTDFGELIVIDYHNYEEEKGD